MSAGGRFMDTLSPLPVHPGCQGTRHLHPNAHLSWLQVPGSEGEGCKYRPMMQG